MQIVFIMSAQIQSLLQLGSYANNKIVDFFFSFGKNILSLKIYRTIFGMKKTKHSF